MKQGKIFNRIVEVVLLCAILAYFGYSIFSVFSNPLTTTQAIAYETGSGCYTSGYVVREEQVLTSSYPITLLTQSEGAKVGAGQVLAVGYQSQDAQERQSEITQLESQLEQLEAVASYQADPAAMASMDQEIVEKLKSFAIYTNRGDMGGLEQVSPDLKTLILQRTSDSSDLATIRGQISDLKGQLSSLQAQAGSDTHSLTASQPGYFSGSADGYESLLTVDKLSSIGVQDLKNLEPATVSDKAYGRLITSKTWYYVTTVPADQLEKKVIGETVLVSFAHDFYDAISMEIVRIGDPEAGTCVLVLSCDDYIQDVTLLRAQSADIVFTTYSGLRVPKEAVRVENGQAGVYILESATAKWKPITILYDSEESYIVALDQTSTGNLWPGDEIIINARDLFDGKVIS